MSINPELLKALKTYDNIQYSTSAVGFILILGDGHVVCGTDKEINIPVTYNSDRIVIKLCTDPSGSGDLNIVFNEQSRTLKRELVNYYLGQSLPDSTFRQLCQELIEANLHAEPLWPIMERISAALGEPK